MADALPPPNEGAKDTDVLKAAATEHATRMAWVHQRIADASYHPLPPPAVWQGRDVVINGAMQVFGIEDIANAARLVDLACDELYSKAGTRKDVEKRLTLMRIADIRQLVRKAIRDGRKEVTYKADEKDEGKLKPIKVKEYQGVDMAAVARLLQLEDFQCRLQGLYDDEESGVDTVAAMFEELQKAVEGKRGSMAQRIREVPVDQLPEAGQQQIVAAIGQMNRKNVKAKVLPPPKEGDDEHGPGESADGD